MAFFLEKPKTESTPYVLVDEEKSYMLFEGMSFHENAVVFYNEIKEWLGGYVETDFSLFTFDCKLTYSNSSTSKILYDLLMLMDDHVTPDKRMVVNWHVGKEDEMLIELCEDIQEDYENLEVNLIMT